MQELLKHQPGVLTPRHDHDDGVQWVMVCEGSMQGAVRSPGLQGCPMVGDLGLSQVDLGHGGEQVGSLASQTMVPTKALHSTSSLKGAQTSLLKVTLPVWVSWEPQILSMWISMKVRSHKVLRLAVGIVVHVAVGVEVIVHLLADLHGDLPPRDDYLACLNGQPID